MRSPYEPSESGRSSVSGVFKRKAEALTRLHICAGVGGFAGSTYHIVGNLVTPIMSVYVTIYLQL